MAAMLQLCGDGAGARLAYQTDFTGQTMSVCLSIVTICVKNRLGKRGSS